MLSSDYTLMAAHTSPAESSHRKQENKMRSTSHLVPCGWTATVRVGAPVSHCDDSLWRLIAEISAFEKL